MVTSEKHNAEMLQLLPCPFCGSQIEHVKSWAKSFQPNRLYHEWHHVADNIEICPVRRNIGKIVASATDDSEMRDDAISRWNNRTAAPSPHPRGEPVGYVSAATISALGEPEGSGPVVACAAFDTIIPLYAVPPPAGADAVRETARLAFVAGYWLWFGPANKHELEHGMADIEHGWTEYAAEHFPAPQPQEKSTGDQT